MKTPTAIVAHSEKISKYISKSSEKLAQLYKNCFYNFLLV